jgi:hypothetical protein
LITIKGPLTINKHNPSNSLAENRIQNPQ